MRERLSPEEIAKEKEEFSNKQFTDELKKFLQLEHECCERRIGGKTHYLVKKKCKVVSGRNYDAYYFEDELSSFGAYIIDSGYYPWTNVLTCEFCRVPKLRFRHIKLSDEDLDTFFKSLG